MVFDITQLKNIRKQLGLTQHKFAQKAGLSQSLIAKIEAQKLDPTYSKVKQIELALDLLTKRHEKQAHEIMVKNLISVSSQEKTSNIINLMKQHAISQVPVLDNERVIGLISESTILNKDLENIQNLKARDIMGDSPPIIAKDTNLEIIKKLLQYYPLVLVKEKGKLIGLITKADLISSLV